MSTIDTIVNKIDAALDENGDFADSNYRYQLDELEAGLDDAKSYVRADWYDYVTTDRFDSERGRQSQRVERIA